MQSDAIKVISSEFFTQPTAEDTNKPEGLIVIYVSQDGPTMLLCGEVMGKKRVFKALKPDFRGNELYERMLRKEFEIGYSLSHPGIAQTISFLNLPQCGNCIEMEWIDGMTLDEYARAGRSQDSLRRVMLQVCDALSYLHSRQVCHRDIKPSNILVTHNGHNVKIVDFSLSDSDSHALLKNPAGTKHYAAPELLGRESSGDARSDIYSLGMVMKDLGLFPKAASRCCQPSPGKRFQDIDAVKKSIEESNGRRLQVIIGIASGLLAVIVAAMAALRSGQDRTNEKIFDQATQIILRKEAR